MKDNDNILFSNKIIYDKQSNIWYLPNKSGSGKKNKEIYNSLAVVLSVKDNFIIVNVVKLLLFKSNFIMQIKQEALKVPTKEQADFMA